MNVLPRYRQELRPALWVLTVLSLALVLIWMLPPSLGALKVEGYVQWHMLLETIAILISVMAFAVCWTGYTRERDSNLLLLGCAFLGVAMLD